MITNYLPLIRKNHITFYLSDLRYKYPGPAVNNPWRVISNYRLIRKRHYFTISTGILAKNLNYSNLPFSVKPGFSVNRPQDLKALYSRCYRHGYLEYPLLYKVFYSRNQPYIQFKTLVRNSALRINYLKHTSYHIMGIAFIRLDQLNIYRNDITIISNPAKSPRRFAYFANQLAVMFCLAAHRLNWYGTTGPAKSKTTKCRLRLSIVYGLAGHQVVTMAPAVTEASYGGLTLKNMDTFVYHTASSNGIQTVRPSQSSATAELADMLKPRNIKSSPYIKYYDTGNPNLWLQVVSGRLISIRILRTSPWLITTLTANFNLTPSKLSPRPIIKTRTVRLHPFWLKLFGHISNNPHALVHHLPVICPRDTRIAIFYRQNQFQALAITKNN